MPRALRSLRTELLVSLGFVTSAAVILAGLTTALVVGADLQGTLWPLLVLWFGSTLVFVSYGTYVVRRAVIKPLERLAAEADTLAAGRVAQSDAVYESTELVHLADRYRAMARDLLDVRSHVVRVEKLAGIGTLAAGVAHEIRNPLGALGTYVDLLRRRAVEPEVTGAMRAAIDRIERTVQSLLEYARPGGSEGPADLNQAVAKSLEFLRLQGLLDGHRLVLRLERDLPPVAGDPHLLEQVIVNLVVNACQASPGGAIEVGTLSQEYRRQWRRTVRRGDGRPGEAARRRRPDGWAPRPRRADLPPGTPGALLYVADDGPGVPEEDRERVFDPFFTTKDPGQGTGLGLAVVARTVHQSGGTVWVDRAREGGAVFKVFLPFALQPVSSAAEPSHAPAHC